MKVQAYHIVTTWNVATTDVSALTNLSYTWDMRGATEFSIENSWGTGVQGTFALQERNAGTYRTNTDVTWTQPTTAAGANGQVVNVVDAQAKEYKLLYTHAAGDTGPLQSWIIIKNWT